MSRSATLRTRRDRGFSTGPGKDIYVANQGTVINFDGSLDPIPPRYIQLTRGLLYLASLQAAALARMDAPPHGVVPLDRKSQDDWVKDDWVKMVKQDLARTGESLEVPRF